MDFEDIKWWVEDNWKTLLGLTGIVTFLGIGFFMFYVEADRSGSLPDSYEEQIETLQEGTELVKDTFSLFDQVDVSTFDGQSVYELSIYNKKPFIDKADLEKALRTYIETLKIVESTNKKQVRAVKFNIYDRKIKYDIGAKPDGIYYYGIPYTSLPKEEKDDEKSRYYYMTPAEVAYEYTSLYAPEKIDESKYQVYGTYKQLRKVSGIEPLTDQEYNWFVKLNMYTALGADSGSLYLEWELGAPKSDSVTRLFRQDVRNYRKRLTAFGDESTIFGDDSVTVRELKRRLVIENPSFLWYAETGKLEENAIEARKLLVDAYPGDYKQLVEEWVQTLAEDQVKQMQNGEDPATTGQSGKGLSKEGTSNTTSETTKSDKKDTKDTVEEESTKSDTEDTESDKEDVESDKQDSGKTPSY